MEVGWVPDQWHSDDVAKHGEHIIRIGFLVVQLEDLHFAAVHEDLIGHMLAEHG